MGESLHVSDLALGDAITVLTDPERTIASVTAPKVVATDDEEAEALEADLEGAEEAPEATEDA